NYAGNEKGVQVGLVNVVQGEFNGLQIGLVCYANKGTYLQIGLLTLRGQGSWHSRMTPLIGWHK
ncbi:MAG: hypothetical protein AABX05_01390, partial [Nanoarchaeota archaeon]